MWKKEIQLDAEDDNEEDDDYEQVKILIKSIHRSKPLGNIQREREE